MRAKYYLKDLKRRPLDQPLPDDVNEQPENIAKRLNDPGLVKALEVIKNRHWYGKHYHRDEKGNIDAIFEFQYGVCTGVDLEKILDERNIFSLHHRNMKVSLKGKPESEQESKEE